MTALLYATVVLCWSFTWYAIKMQFGVVPAEVSILWRFGSAAAIMWLGLIVSGRLRRVPPARHVWFALTGLSLFGLNFVLIYEAERLVASGVVSVIFTLSTVFNIVNARIFNGARPSPRVILGAGLGVLGVFLLFAEALGGLEGGRSTQLGVGAAAVRRRLSSFSPRTCRQ